MDIRTLTDNVSVAPQISTADIARLKELGFRTLICNRPDGEDAGQPSFAQIEEAARNAGLQTRHIPVTGAGLSAHQVDAFKQALDTLSTPILAYCRSGTRSTILWALSQADAMPKSEIIETACAAGYEVAPYLA